MRPHPHLYEINTWVWLEGLSARSGSRLTLGKVPDSEWDLLQALGFDLVWLMGIWQRSPASRRIGRRSKSLFPRYNRALPKWTKADIVGSPYAVRRYQPDPRIGTWAELDAVREKLHARGMGLILDFVPNHTALDHRWVEEHPDYYVTGTEESYRRKRAAFFGIRQNGKTVYLARGRDPFFEPWRDTAQLNYFNPGLRRAMIEELKTIATHCDGVRCDMAMLALNDVFARTWEGSLAGQRPPRQEFWAEARAAARHLLLIGEVYWGLEARLQELGFDFTYDKVLYDRLRNAPPRDVFKHLTMDISYQQRTVRFLENHDEPRSLPLFGAERLEAVGTLLATIPGMRFYHHGQLHGRKVHLPLQLARAVEEPPDAQVRNFYERVLRLSNQEAFHDGAWRLLEVRPAGEDNWKNLIAYRWRTATALKLVVTNLGNEPTRGQVQLGGELDARHRYLFDDQLNENVYEREGKDVLEHGLFARLEGGKAHLFDVHAGS